MLYFSETAWTLPNMPEVNAQFEATYDEGEFEQKIAAIVRNLQLMQAGGKDAQREWKEAIALPRNEDHYLLVLIDSAGSGSVRPRGDFVKLVLAALGIVSVVVVAALYFGDR